MGPAFDGVGDTPADAVHDAVRAWFHTLDARGRAVASLSKFRVLDTIAVVHVLEGIADLGVTALTYRATIQECKQP